MAGALRSFDLGFGDNEDHQFAHYNAYSTQDGYNSIDPSLLNYTQSQPPVTTQSAPQLISGRMMAPSPMRSYHSGPMTFSDRNNGLDAPKVFQDLDTGSNWPVDLNFDRQEQEENSSFQNESTSYPRRLRPSNDLIRSDDRQSRGFEQNLPFSSPLDQISSQSSASHLRKRLRPHDENSQSSLDEDQATEQMQNFSTTMVELSSEDKTRAICLIRSWLKDYSAEAPPSRDDKSALAILTRLTIKNVDELLVQMMLSGESKISALPAQTLPSSENSVNQSALLQPRSMSSSTLQASRFRGAVLWSKRRAPQCRPTQSRNLFRRNEAKIYQCTLGCGKAFKRKGDWTRHETTNNFPQEAWLCDTQTRSTVNDISTCSYCGLKDPSMDHAVSIHGGLVFCHDKPLRKGVFFRKDKFIKHCEEVHPSLDTTEQVDRAHFWIHSVFPSYCGFCREMKSFSTCRDRFDHLAAHFEAGRDMLDWMQSHFPESEDDNDDDSDDDDDGYDSNIKNSFIDHAERTQEYPHAKQYSKDSGYSSKGSGKFSVSNVGSSFEVKHGRQCTTNEGFPECNKTSSAKNNTGQLLMVSTKKALPSLTTMIHQPPLSPSSEFASNPMLAAVPFEKELRNAFVDLSAHQFFFPESALDTLITEKNIERALRGNVEKAFENSNLPSHITRTSRRIFAILTYMGKETLISRFLDMQITDRDLPFEIPLKFLKDKDQVRLPGVFADWSWRDIDEFYRVQWCFNAPVFRRPCGNHQPNDSGIPHYELNDNTVLPFLKSGDGLDRAGGFSDVWQVQIHPAHQQLLTPINGKPTSLAIKRLISRDPTEFKREVEILQSISQLDNRHFVQLLMTYKFKKQYHLVFPNAKSNLRAFWYSQSILEDTARIRWCLEQMKAIVSALRQIHCFGQNKSPSAMSPCLKSPHEPSDSWDVSDPIYGRHGDIKAENILWFDDLEGNPKYGLLAIADFGLTRFNSAHSRSNQDPCMIGGSTTYAPPEMLLRRPISRAYDIWSLGCLFLEFVTWLVCGFPGLEAFGDARMVQAEDGVMDDIFYGIVDDNSKPLEVIVRPGVQLWIAELHKHRQCSPVLHELLDLISGQMLRCEPKERIIAENLEKDLSRMVEKATSDSKYLEYSNITTLVLPKEQGSKASNSLSTMDLKKPNSISALGQHIPHWRIVFAHLRRSYSCGSKSSNLHQERSIYVLSR